MGIYQLAQKAELEGDWLKARELWLSINRTSDADACDLIISSIKQGDAYRQRVLDECGEEPDKEEPRKWIKWYDGMTKIYREMFN